MKGVIQNIKRKESVDRYNYNIYLNLIKREILDTFRSRKTSTMNASHRELKLDIQLSEDIGLDVKKS